MNRTVFHKIFFALTILIAFVQPSAWAQTDSNISIYKIIRFIQYVGSEYVDSVDVNKLVDDAIIETLKKLDPHSVYITKEDVQAMNEPLQGNFEGIGIEFNILKDTLMVVNPIPGGPSQKVGIMAGDRIITVDGENIAGVGISNSDVQKKLRGNKDTQVTLEILRKSNENLLEFTITRDKIPIHSLDASYMIDNKIGYIKLNRFALTTEEEFTEALKKLKKEKMEHLVLDLRGNGGGYLNAAVELADHFLNNNQLIVYTEGRNVNKTDFTSSSKGNFKKGRVVVLVDEGSASASEIVAGAIQDWDRGIIIGRRSFGKGLVQNQVPLPDGSMIRLTVARYHTPTGRVIQKPYNVKEIDKYYSELNERYGSGELFHSDSINVPDSLKYFTLNKKKVVYGGGGIIPDIFMPVDTSFYSDYYAQLIRKGIINQFMHTYIDNNRSQLKPYAANFDKFNKKFNINQAILDELITFAEKEGLEFNQEEFNISQEQISLQLKALFAQHLYTTSHYFQIINQNNNAFQKAIEVINNWEEYKHLVYN